MPELPATCRTTQIKCISPMNGQYAEISLLPNNVSGVNGLMYSVSQIFDWDEGMSF
jgi:hypothetical protein